MSPIVSGVFGQVDRQEVGLADELLEPVDELHAELAGPLAADERVVGDELHAERERPLRDEHADAAEADDPERLAVQLDALPAAAVPLAALQVGVGLGDVAGLRQQQRDRVLGRRQHVRLRGVDHHHAAAAWRPRRRRCRGRCRPGRPRRGRGRPSSTSAVTRVALRITSAAAPGTASRSSSGDMPSRTSTSKPAARNASRPLAAICSATRTRRGHEVEGMTVEARVNRDAQKRLLAMLRRAASPRP